MNLMEVLLLRTTVAPEIASQIQALSAAVPTAAAVDGTGLVSFKNSSGSTLFTLQLPVYTGGVQ